MEVNKKQLADIFGASIRTIQNWQEQGMPVLRGGGKGNEVLYDSAAVRVEFYSNTVWFNLLCECRRCHGQELPCKY